MSKRIQCCLLVILFPVCLLAAYWLTRQAAETRPTTAQLVLVEDQAEPLLAVPLEGLWYEGFYYIVSFSASKDAYQVQRYTARLDFVESTQGESWAKIGEKLPPNFIFWDSGSSSLVTAQEEESFSGLDCDKMTKLSAEGPYVFSTKKKNQLTICTDPKDATSYRSYDLSGVVDLKALSPSLVAVKTLQNHDNQLLLVDSRSGEILETLDGNYEMLMVEEKLVLKPSLFVGQQAEEEVHCYDLSTETWTQLPMNVAGLFNIRFSEKGSFMLGTREGQFERYECSNWSLQKLPCPLASYDAYENEELLTLSEDGSRLRLYDKQRGRTVLYELS